MEASVEDLLTTDIDFSTDGDAATPDTKCRLVYNFFFL